MPSMLFVTNPNANSGSHVVSFPRGEMSEQPTKGRGRVFKFPRGLNRAFLSPDSLNSVLPKNHSPLFIQVQVPQATFKSLFSGLTRNIIVNIVVACLV